MNTVSSNSVFHFTNSWDNLIGILENEFYPNYSLERLAISINSYRAIPMVCFCDIPLSQIKNHIKTYGYYALGMSKRWAEKNGLNPVFYLKDGSIISNQLYSMIMKTPSEKEHRELSRSVINLISYTKPYNGILYKENKNTKKVRFYDEIIGDVVVSLN